MLVLNIRGESFTAGWRVAILTQPGV